MIRLSLLQNGLHSLYHAVEHLDQARQSTWDENKKFSSDDHSVAVRSKGAITYYSEKFFTKPPPEYQYKFAILHLIHGVELLIKAYLHKQSPESILRRNGRQTISFREGVGKIVDQHTSLLSIRQRALLDRTVDIRDSLEHNEINIAVETAAALSVDFLSIANLLAFSLHEIRLANEFSYDAWNDDHDPVGDLIGELLADASTTGETASQQFADLYKSWKPETALYLCPQCKSRGGDAENGLCVVCGSEVDVEFSKMVGGLDELTEQFIKLRISAEGHGLPWPPTKT